MGELYQSGLLFFLRFQTCEIVSFIAIKLLFGPSATVKRSIKLCNRDKYIKMRQGPRSWRSNI